MSEHEREQEQETRRPAEPLDEADDFDLMGHLIALGRHRRLLLAGPVAAAMVAAGISLQLPNTFTASTTILPPQQGQSTASAMLAQLSGSPLAGAASGVLGLKSPNDLYLEMLRSDAVADVLISRFELRRAYALEQLVDVRGKLDESSSFRADKSGLIFVQVEAGDPKLAADLANGYVEELNRLTSRLAITEAAQRRVFFERQLELAKEKLADAEVQLREAIASGGIVSVDLQGRAALETAARLRGQITALEIQLGAMRAYATPSNPDLLRREQELASMRREVARVETGLPEGSADASGGKARGIGTIRLLREVKYRETVFELLTKQYELARIDESRDTPIVQVLDPATPPERKSGPKRASLVQRTYFFSLFLALGVAFILNAHQRRREDPVRRAQLERLRKAWTGRPGDDAA